MLNTNLVALTDQELKGFTRETIQRYEDLRYVASYEKVSVQDLRALEAITSKYHMMGDLEGVQLNQALNTIIEREESPVEKLERQRAQKANISHQTKNLMNRQIFTNRYN